MRTFLMPFGLAVLLTQPLIAAAQVAAPAPSAAPLAGDAAGTVSTTLTLAAAIEMAFQHNPGLKAAAQGIGISAGLRTQAAARPNPELSYLAEGVRNDSRTTTVQVNQAIEIGGKRAARIAVAEREQEIASAELAGYRSNLRADVITAFFDVLTAQERVTLAEATQQLSRRVTEVAARRVTAGRVSPVEETRARVAEGSSKVELNQAASELALAKRRLAATWGSTVPSFGQVEAPADPVRTYPSESELAAYLPGAPRFARARLEVDRQKALADVERSRRVPDLTVSVGSKRDEQFGQRQTVLGLSVPLPLFDRNQGNLLSALRRTDRARDELLAMENSLSVELTQAALRQEAAKADLRIMRSDILPGAQSAYEATTKGFELGKFSFLDVLDAQRTVFQSKAQFVRALAESYRAGADIERLLGRPVSTVPTP